MAKKKSKDDVVRIDFSKEEEGGGGGRIRLPEDDYKAKIIKAKSIRAKDKDTPGVLVTFKITEGNHKGKEISDRLWITPKALFRIRALLEAIGVSVPKKAMAIPLKKLIGKELGITVTDDDPYEGKIRSQVSDYIDLDTLADIDDDDDEDEDDDDETEDDESSDDDDDEDIDEMDRAELKAYIKENDLDVKVKKSMDEDDIREAIREAEGDDDDDDDDDDEGLEELDLDDEI